MWLRTMSRFGIVLVLAVATVLSGCDQEHDAAETEGTVELPDAIGRWQAAGEVATYDPESIFAYIDGHAEVYLAYGMERCSSRQYGSESGAEVVVDAFEMASREDAFGVFTHDRDGKPVDVGHGARLRPGWLSVWYGRWYLSVYNLGLVEPHEEALVELARGVVESLPDPGDGSLPPIVRTLPEAGLDRSSVRFLRTFGILNTHLYMGTEDPFGLGADVSAVLAAYERNDAVAWLLAIEFPGEPRASQAVTRFSGGWLNGEPGACVQREDGFYAIERAASRVAVVLAAGSSELCEELLADGIEGATRGGMQ